MASGANKTRFRRFKKEVRPFQIETPNKAFIKEWIACRKNPSRDRTTLIKMLEPFVKQYAKMFFYKEVPKDINFISTIVMVESMYKDNYEVLLEKIVETVGTLEDLEQDIWVTILHTLNRLRFDAEDASDIMKEYTVAINWKGNFKNRLVYYLSRYKDYVPLIDIHVIPNQELICDNVDIYRFIARHPKKHYIIYMLGQIMDDTDNSDIEFLRRVFNA